MQGKLPGNLCAKLAWPRRSDLYFEALKFNGGIGIRFEDLLMHDSLNLPAILFIHVAGDFKRPARNSHSQRRGWGGVWVEPHFPTEVPNANHRIMAKSRQQPAGGDSNGEPAGPGVKAIGGELLRSGNVMRVFHSADSTPILAPFPSKSARNFAFWPDLGRRSTSHPRSDVLKTLGNRSSCLLATGGSENHGQRQTRAQSAGEHQGVVGCTSVVPAKCTSRIADPLRDSVECVFRLVSHIVEAIRNTIADVVGCLIGSFH